MYIKKATHVLLDVHVGMTTFHRLNRSVLGRITGFCMLITRLLALLNVTKKHAIRQGSTYTWAHKLIFLNLVFGRITGFCTSQRDVSPASTPGWEPPMSSEAPTSAEQLVKLVASNCPSQTILFAKRPPSQHSSFFGDVSNYFRGRSVTRGASPADIAPLH